MTIIESRFSSQVIKNSIVAAYLKPLDNELFRLIFFPKTWKALSSPEWKTSKLNFRTRDEIQEVRQTRDPITGFREKLVAAGLADADELKAIEVSRPIRFVNNDD